MAWLRVTPHYKGHFPLDGGGVQFGGYGPKEVTPDTFAAACAGQNFPYIVPCTREGKYLVDVPAIEVKVEVLVPEVKAEKVTRAAEAKEEAVSDSTVGIEVEVSKTKKGK